MRAAANPKSSEGCALGGMGAFPDVAPPLAHAMPAPRGAPHGWGEEEEPAFAATGTGIGCFPRARAEAPLGGAGRGIGTIPGAKEEGPTADDDDAIGWLDDPACPSGTGIGSGGASSTPRVM